MPEYYHGRGGLMSLACEVFYWMYGPQIFGIVAGGTAPAIILIYIYTKSAAETLGIIMAGVLIALEPVIVPVLEFLAEWNGQPPAS